MRVHYATRSGRAAAQVWSTSSAAARAATLALLPAELLFRLGSMLYHARYDRGLTTPTRAHVPVISIGNLTVGGTGKTPFTRWLVAELKRRGRAPAVLHGGYGLDEPALHGRWHADIPIVIGRDRVAGARAAVRQGADVLVLDDGFQHRRLARQLDIVLVAAEQWTPRPRRLPRGPWREGPAALRRADLVVVTRKTASPEQAAGVGEAVAAHTRAPLAVARLEPTGWLGSAAAAPARPGVVLVTAVADWRDVAAHARTAGAVIDEALIFPDHHAYGAVDAERIRRFAGRRSIVCTEKDWVKLEPLLPPDRVHVLLLGCALERGSDAVSGKLHAVLGS
jgi:tetraacyldisaccharide 4'-kinase